MKGSGYILRNEQMDDGQTDRQIERQPEEEDIWRRSRMQKLHLQKRKRLKRGSKAEIEKGKVRKSDPLDASHMIGM